MVSKIPFSLHYYTLTQYMYTLRIEPCSQHVLNLSQPYDRAILIELLDIVASDTNINIASFEYVDRTINSRPSTPKPRGQSNKASTRESVISFNDAKAFRLVKLEEDFTDLCTAEKRELLTIQSFDRMARISAHDLRLLAKVRCL
jgi:hypothetical protein